MNQLHHQSFNLNDFLDYIDSTVNYRVPVKDRGRIEDDETIEEALHDLK